MIPPRLKILHVNCATKIKDRDYATKIKTLHTHKLSKSQMRANMLGNINL